MGLQSLRTRIGSLGAYGIETGTPIINARQSTLVFAGAIVRTVVAGENDAIRIAPIMKLSVCFDHRFIDGVTAAGFTTGLKTRLESLVPRTLTDIFEGEKMRFKEKVAVVTGGASGQGLETCKRLASKGALVIVADWNGEGAKRTADEIGGKAFEVNVAHESEVAALIDFAVSSHRRLDILINNAGVRLQLHGSVHHGQRREDARGGLGCDSGHQSQGVAMGCKHAIPIMVKQGGGVIVNIASINGIAGLTGADAYTAAKGGVVALTCVLAVDWAAKGVRVNCVCPGAVDTPMIREALNEPGLRNMVNTQIPLGRIAEPNEIAAVSLFLASDDASFLHGEFIPVDGGQVAQ